METPINRYHNLSLRKYLIFSVIVTLSVIVLLSAFTIYGCISFRKYILPDSDRVFLTIAETYSDGREISYSVAVDVGEEGAELPFLISDDATSSVGKEVRYTIQRIENNVNSLSPKRKLAYDFCGIAMVMLPFSFSIAGILLCGLHFYKRKLSIPLKLLSEATKQIAEQNLDFSLRYNNADEMGTLCNSFEKMRLNLYENYREMWNMLEGRRLLQASIAHDLRNPIAIIEGYTEYLQINIKKGILNEERILKIAENLNLAAKRLECYTESVRTINQMEDIEINRQKMRICDFLFDIEEDLRIMAQKRHIHLKATTLLSDEEIRIDTSLLYRVMENIFGNALRYAKKSIGIDVSLNGSKLCVVITDDGNGFTDEILARQKKLLLAKPSEDGHLGMGLAISRILCEKHGGSIKLCNNENHNAVVKIVFLV